MPNSPLNVFGRTRTTLVVIAALLLVLTACQPAPPLAPRSPAAAPSPAPGPALLWSAGQEGSSPGAEWERDWGGGLFNSGSYDVARSSEVVRSGSGSLRARIWTPGTSGVRAFRWKEPREHRELFFSAWVYLEPGTQVTGSFVNLFQFKSRSTDGRNDPVWGLYGVADGAGGIRLQAGWGWGGTPLSGPTASDGVGGKWIRSSKDATLPTGRWVHLEGFVRQSKDFDGRVRFWRDGVELFDLQNVRTSFANCSYNSWCASNEWSVNLYSDGLSKSPATMYIDDAAIATSYIP